MRHNHQHITKTQSILINICLFFHFFHLNYICYYMLKDLLIQVRHVYFDHLIAYPTIALKDIELSIGV